MRLSEIRQVLAERDIRLTKSLGQNFLHDANQLGRIIAAGQVAGGDRVLEIGPGLGALTELLVARAGHVLAIEKDRRLFEFLRSRFADAPRLELHCEDALDYLHRSPADWSGWKLVGNLPYSAASAMLVELAAGDRCPERLVTTLQLEVARRLLAPAGTADYGVLTLLVQLNYESAGWFKIPTTCFHPVPEVDSACVTLLRKKELPLPGHQIESFVRIVKRSFSQRRKVMLKLLREDWPSLQLGEAFEDLRLPPQVRAEEVALEKFVGLTKRLALDEKERT